MISFTENIEHLYVTIYRFDIERAKFRFFIIRPRLMCLVARCSLYGLLTGY